MSISSPKRPIIGILIDYFVEYYQKKIWDGMIKASDEMDVNEIFYLGGDINSPRRHHAPKNIIYDLVNTDDLDGLIVLSATVGNFIKKNDLRQFIERFASIPIVSIGVILDGIHSISIDNFSGMYEVVEHLIKKHGHRKLAFIKGVEGNEEGELRFNAYKKVLDNYGIDYNPDLVVQGDFYYGTGEKAVTTLIDERKADFDAIIAANDIMAIDTINELKKRNIYVPYDVAVVGFDDIDEAGLIKPSLTTVAQPLEEIGYTSVKLLLSILNNKHVDSVTKLFSKMVARSSCGCFSHGSNYIIDKGKNNNKQYSYTKKFGLSENGHLDEIINHARLKIDNLNLSIDLSTLLNRLLIELRKYLSDPLNNDFFKLLEKIVEEFIPDEISPLNLIFVITHIFSSIKMNMRSGEYANELNMILNYSYGIIWGSEREIQTRIRMRTEEKLRELHVISIQLITAFDMKKLRAVILKEVPKLGFNRCHVYLYSNENDIELSERIIYFKNSENIFYHDESVHEIRSRDLLSFIFKEELGKKISLIVMPLYFENIQVGFIVFDANRIPGIIYENFVIQLGGALRGIKLMEKIYRHSEELEKKVIQRTIRLEKAKAELERINRQLTKLDNFKNDFIANITHDLRSPLTAILNVADLSIKFDNEISEEDRKNYQIIYEASIRLKSSIDRLFELAKIDAEGVKLKIKRVPVVSFVNRTAEFYSSSVTGSTIKIIKKIPNKEISDFYTDPEKLEEILNNILSNAIRFVDPVNGIITIELEDKKNNILISISDNGIGIPKDKLEAIFNRFEHVHSGRNIPYNGTGIGLSFTRQLLDYLKGKIWAESEGEGKGAKFLIELKKGMNIFNKEDFSYEEIKPKINDDIKILIQSELRDRIRTGGVITRFSDLNKENEFDYKKAVILIIDDDKNAREIVIRYLINYDYKNFIEASNGKQGLDAVYEYSPQLIICDFNMPELRGDQFHDELLTNPNYRNTPFVFLSAISDQNLILERRKKGASVFLKKPIDEKDLFYTVEQLLMKFYEYLKTVQLATCDELTNLSNRRKIIEDLRHELSARKCRDISLVFIDLDNFKDINDTYGHKAGDRVLSYIGELLKSSIRDYDFAGRYGGEEFLLILPDTNLEQAVTAANSLREKIKTDKIMYENSLLNITASFGVSSLIESQDFICNYLKINDLDEIYNIKDPRNTDWEKIKGYKLDIMDILLRMSDKALYEAKKTTCRKCGFSSEKSYIFIEGLCPKCRSNDLIKGRDKVISFSGKL